MTSRSGLHRGAAVTLAVAGLLTITIGTAHARPLVERIAPSPAGAEPVGLSAEVLSVRATGSDRHLVLLNDDIARRQAITDFVRNRHQPPCGYPPIVATPCPV